MVNSTPNKPACFLSSLFLRTYAPSRLLGSSGKFHEPNTFPHSLLSRRPSRRQMTVSVLELFHSNPSRFFFAPFDYRSVTHLCAIFRRRWGCWLRALPIYLDSNGKVNVFALLVLLSMADE